MSAGFNRAAGKRPVGGKSCGFVGWSAVMAAGLGLSSLTALSPAVALSQDEITAESYQEDSVLIATREAPTSKIPPVESSSDASCDDGDNLEPISQTSDHTPELAVHDSQGNSAEQFGAALTKAAGSKTKQTEQPRPAAHTSRRAAKQEKVPFEPAKFNGITAGESTKQDLIQAWGDPDTTGKTSDGTVLTYHTEPFQEVEALVSHDGVVSAIKIELADELNPQQLAKQLSLSEFEAVTVKDEENQELGQAFPERGVLFMYTADEHKGSNPKSEKKNPTVTHVVIQPLDAHAFALRAESHLHGPYQANISDLKTALSLDPQMAQAHWLLSEIFLATGQADQAEAEASEACSQEPKNAAFQLRHGETLELLGQYDEAVHEVRAVLDREDVAPIVRAQALHVMARLASLGDAQIASKAIPFDTKAIEIADQLATSKNTKERKAAKQLLVDAHLAIAEEVARQAFNKKVDSMSQWIGRASGLAEDCITNDGGSIELRLRVAQSALASLSSFKPTLDPAPWVAEAEEAGKALAQQSTDPTWQQRVKWEMGIAYMNALKVEHLRRNTSAAQRYGQLAIENLAEGAASRQAVHSSEQLVGQLYFQMGAVYAILEQDHVKAAQWFDKAAPLLSAPRPVSELYSPRREGEMLVSMGVSYWQLGQQARALEVTQAGADLIELAVNDGILAKTALAAPYGNLATMYQGMGEETNATKYAELAKTAGTASAIPTKASTTTRSNITGAVGDKTIQTNAQQARPSSIINAPANAPTGKTSQTGQPGKGGQSTSSNATSRNMNSQGMPTNGSTANNNSKRPSSQQNAANAKRNHLLEERQEIARRQVSQRQ